MHELRTAIGSKRPLLMDGAMGSELMRRGLKLGDNSALWNLDHPEEVAAIHREYANAGARILLTNTFQIHPAALARCGRENDLEAVAAAGLRLARTAAPNAWVLGDIGPMSAAAGDADFPNRDDFLRVVGSLATADGILLETCSDLRVREAIDWAQTAWPALTVLVAFTFRREESGDITTFTNHTPEEVARALRDAPIAALGVNCGRDIDMPALCEIVRRYRNESDLPILARPNAGTPTLVGDEWVYPRTAETMADAIPSLIAAGATLVGGCCGTTPAFIRACARHFAR